VSPISVIPAKAGIQLPKLRSRAKFRSWTPAFAGVTLLFAAPSTAEVTTSAPDGFISRSSAVVALPPAKLWAALIQWDRWWSPAHSYSGKTVRIEPRAGGQLREDWDGKSVRHATVVNYQPPTLLRLEGGFGPLQSLPVTAVLDFALKEEGAGTRMTMTYRVAGTAASKLDTLAAPVDAVMSEGFRRLTRFATTGTPV
jgi:uncharacterized protein YndB with AHSA1/START domain